MKICGFEMLMVILQEKIAIGITRVCWWTGNKSYRTMNLKRSRHPGLNQEFFYECGHL